MIPLLIIIATFFYAIAAILISRASLHMNSSFAGAIVNAVGAILPFSIYLLFRGGRFAQANTSMGIILAILAGIAIAIFTLSLTKTFSLGGNLSYVTPIVFGGTILISSLAGYGLFHEKITLLQVIGIALIAIGIIFISFARMRDLA